MSKSKEEIVAIREKRKSAIESAVRNAVISLRKMGITSADVEVDDSGGVAYIMFKVDDVVKLIQRKTKASVKKVAGSSVEVVCYVEDDVIVVRVRK